MTTPMGPRRPAGLITVRAAAITLVDRTVANPDRALIGTRWVVDTLITSDVASSVPAGVVAFLQLGTDGRVHGSTLTAASGAGLGLHSGT
jgi:hypothetical protein